MDLRASGIRGNPSEGYFGITLAFALSKYRVRSCSISAGRLGIKPSEADLAVFENSKIGTGPGAAAVTTEAL